MKLAVRLLALLAATLSVALPASGSVRIKDIADFQGARDNMLVGYGLVVGLPGTGDDLTRDIFTRQSLIGMLDRLGVNATDPQLRTKNVAAVMVTATLPAFARAGGRIDVDVSAMGDAANLQGGTLVVTPLLGADGEVYAVAQGTVSVPGYSARGQGATVTKGVPTDGAVPNGAIVEREIPFKLNSLPSLDIALRNPDFTTAERMAQVIDGYYGQDIARAVDSGTVRVTRPNNGIEMVDLVTAIEQLRVEPDEPAKVVIDDASGIIVMGENVRISTVAVAQGNLTVRITETPQVSQPAPFTRGGVPPAGAAGAGPPGQGGVQFAPGGGASTTVTPQTNIAVSEGSDRKLAVLPPGVTIQELVNSLNALGIGPRDMIAILQAIKTAGAMQAELVIK